MISDEMDFNDDMLLNAYDEGYSAYYCTHAKTLEDNPHLRYCSEYDAWMRGWLDAHRSAHDE